MGARSECQGVVPVSDDFGVILAGNSTNVITLDEAEVDINLLSIDLSGMTMACRRARLMVLWGDSLETNAGAGAIDGTDQDVAVDSDVAYGSLVPAFAVPDNSLAHTASQAKGGGILTGEPASMANLVAEINAAMGGTLYVQWRNAECDTGSDIELRDYNLILRVWY